MIFNLKCPCVFCQVHAFEKYANALLLNTIIKYKMNKHSEPLFHKVIFHPPGVINFSNFFLTPPKTFQLFLGVGGKEILSLSALSRSCQFLPLGDRTILVSDVLK